MQKIRLFLSSPGDVDKERQKVSAVAAQLNRILGDSLGFHLEVLDWKTHVKPDMGRPQEVINRQIGDYDIFLGIMWKRFGTPTGVAESGTEEEFNIAYANWESFGRPRILFYFSQVPHLPKNSDEVAQLAKVLAFKEKLQKKGLIWEYQLPEEFADSFLEHLAKVLQEWFPSKGKASPVADFTRYLNYLKDETMYIDIRGLVTGEVKAHRFPIDQLYIPLKTSGAGLPHEKARRRAKQRPEEMIPREVPLQEALQEPRLLIKGAPGAGKTTFLRLVGFTLCRRWLGEESVAGKKHIVYPEPSPLPIYVRLGRLTEHIRIWKQKDWAQSPTHEDSPEWLLHFLEGQSHEYNWQLTADDFRHEMESGRCLILLDGLDEAPDPVTREKVSSLADNLLKAFPDCRVVLTSRPAALVGPAMPTGFSSAEISHLDEQAMETFLSQWSKALYPEAPDKAREHQRELSVALRARREIRRMARTPVMLTALAVVHWNENRLPEQRAELYESILTWLFRSRAQRPGRLKTDRCRKLLQKLALAMFAHDPDEGRQRQVELHWAAEGVAGEFVPTREYTAVELAENFLRDEMVDSGITIERGHRLEFWHLSFQEYLAAFEIAGLLETEQLDLLFERERLYSSEWRELVLLLGGVLYKQGEDKINHLIDSIVERGPKRATPKTLPALARKVGLLGGIVHDLSPFDFQPANLTYPEIVRKVMGIFDRATFGDIPVQVRIEAADALGQVGDPRLEDHPMVHIPGGRFWMGAQKRNRKERNFDPDAWEEDFNESPVHEVKLCPFYISKYPISVGQYRRFIEDGGYEEEHYWEAGGFGEFKEPDNWEDQLQYPSRPVVYVSWYEAAAYARWAGGRLPTEAEWERTARGPGEKYRKYPWGDEEPTGETANFVKSNIGHVTPVGIFPGSCSPEGVIDLAGNVWDWCWDWYSTKYYQLCARQGGVKDPHGPEKGSGRVVRGGAFDSNRHILRCSDRGEGYPLDRDVNVGFRVVRGV